MSAIPPAAAGIFISGSYHRPLGYGSEVKPASEMMATMVLQHVKTQQVLFKKEPGNEKEETKLAAQQAARAAVSIKDVIDAGLVKPGPSIVSLAHKDTTYFASLLPSGDIDYEGKTFDSAPAFALHVKRILAPKLSAAEGFRSVHLSGVSLEDLRHRIVLMREAGDNKEGLPPLQLTTPVVPATPLAPEELPVLPSTVDVQLPATEDGTAEGEDEPDTANWVQCSRCQAWRVVPDEFWPDIDAIGDEDWFCNEATWDVTAYEPYTEPCK
ncbi:hypothetical protein QJQ45_025643 [Haematococcus lacustris]|nr:hypothetical protein QJQ45_025643 [Haematococcus lacustris]